MNTASLVADYNDLAAKLRSKPKVADLHDAYGLIARLIGGQAFGPDFQCHPETIALCCDKEFASPSTLSAIWQDIAERRAFVKRDNAYVAAIVSTYNPDRVVQLCHDHALHGVRLPGGCWRRTETWVLLPCSALGRRDADVINSAFFVPSQAVNLPKSN